MIYFDDFTRDDRQDKEIEKYLKSKDRDKIVVHMKNDFVKYILIMINKINKINRDKSNK